MDAFSAFQQNGFRPETLLNFTPLDKPAQQHISKVYAVLAAGVVSTAVGVWFHTNVMALGGLVSGLVSIGCFIAILTSKSHYDAKNVMSSHRLAYFVGFTFCKGMSIAGLIHLAGRIDPSIVPTAICGTLAIFACFSAAALCAKRRQFIFLGGVLGSFVFYLSMASIANIFFRSRFVMDVNLYGGLMIFLGYVIYDTQMIVEQYYAGKKDFLVQACELYLDMIAIFIRLLIILMRNAEKKEDRKKRRS